MSSAGTAAAPMDLDAPPTTNSATTTIDALPDAALDHVLSFLSGDAQSIASALLVCKRWRAAAERAAVLPDVALDEDKLVAIEAGGQEQALLAFLARKSRAVLRSLQLSPAGLQALLPEMLRSLSGGVVHSLELWTQGGIPQEVGALTTLGSLVVIGGDAEDAPPRQIPASALNRLAGLNLLTLGRVAGDLTDDHLAGCTALRGLYLGDIGLSMSTVAALGAWQHLQSLQLLRTRPRGSGPVDYGYWAAVPELTALTKVVVLDEETGPQSSHLRAGLAAGCPSLAILHLENYSEPELPAPLPSLTRLYVASEALEALPPGEALPNLRSLNLFHTRVEIPLSFSTLTHLTAIGLPGNALEEVPHALLSLPGVKVLDLGQNLIEWLPGGRYLASLEHLILDDNTLAGIPPVACAATSLTQLDLSRNPDLCLTREGLEVLRALPGLQMLRVRELGAEQAHELSWAELREALPGLEVVDE